MENLTLSILEACRVSNLGRSFIYMRIADGSIKAVKAGKRNLILYESLKGYLLSLPESQLKSTAPAKGLQP